MDLKLVHEGTFKLRNFKTTNKVEEDAEVLTGYLSFRGLVPGELFATLTGINSQDLGYRRFFWGKDEQSNFPSIDWLHFDVEARAHVVELGSGIRYTDEDASIRKFRLMPEFGVQWLAQFEILVHPKTDAVTGRIAGREGHDIVVKIAGPREGDLFTEKEE